MLIGHGGPEMLLYGDAPDPVAGPDDILVDVHAASVNAADYKVRLGEGGPRSLSLPHILGRDFSGVVAARGAGVTDFAIGDAVFGVTDQGIEGCYAEKLAIKAAIVWVLFGITCVHRGEALRAGSILTGAGEFAFVLFPLGASLGVLDPEQRSVLTAIAAVTMLLGPPVAATADIARIGPFIKRLADCGAYAVPGPRSARLKKATRRSTFYRNTEGWLLVR